MTDSNATSPSSAPASARGPAAAGWNAMAIVAQALLAMGGGAAAGYLAAGESAAVAIGAFGMFAALLAGHGASNGVLLLALPIALARAARRAAAREPSPVPPDEGRRVVALSIHAINATLFAGALACAAALAVFVEAASFGRACAAFALLAFAMSRFSRRAREALE